MLRRLMFVTIAALTVSLVPALAHDDYRVIGTITRVTATALDVKQTKDGKTIAMKTDSATVVTREGGARGARDRPQRRRRRAGRQPGGSGGARGADRAAACQAVSLWSLR
jgi:hypothetical protein